VLHVEYGEYALLPGRKRRIRPYDSRGDAGNITNKFLNGTILDSPAEAVVTIHNPFLNQTLTLDLSNKWNPRRTLQIGNDVTEIETRLHEVWVDFDHNGPQEGNFYRPYKTLEAAAAAVNDGGVIKLMPGVLREPQRIRGNKHIRVVTPVPFTVGARSQ
jgi:hypothetical protein